MPVKKKQGKEPVRPARESKPSPRDAKFGDRDAAVDERAIARKNTKPRSARQSNKGPE